MGRAVAEQLKHRVREMAYAEGFDACGFASADPEARDGEMLARFLGLGFEGDMGWLDNPRRGDPKKIMPDAQTVIVLGANYGPASDPLAPLERRDRGTISVYAQGKDYHDILKKNLKRLARRLVEEEGGDVKVFVDTAPVMEKPLAARAGVGWQGKHTNLVSREFGSWLFLGEVFTTLEIPPDRPHLDRCGSCTRCLEACPTDAFPEPYRLDPRRCISYLTIEHKGDIAPELMQHMGNRIYGCDDCLAVCPWNRFARRGGEPGLGPKMELTAPRLADLAQLDDAGFRQVFAGSPIKRTGRDRFVRNVLIAIGNSGDPSLRPVAERLTDDAAEIVANAARWAAGRLADT
jgi:epoxyqueuosine reductase